MKDPRVNRTKRHLLGDILVITVCAVICGAEEWTSIATFGKAKRKWFKTFLELPNGIPSHDTFRRVFLRLDTTEFTRLFVDWVQTLANRLPDDLVAIDGKTLRNSFDAASKKAAIHMVSAWSAGNRLILGQMCVEDKSNEIVAIPALLDLLNLEGCVVTADAMHCQRKTVQKIVEEKKADYLVTLKSNQTSLHKDVVDFFEGPALLDFEVWRDETVEKGHGRIETRKVTICGQLDWLPQQKRWVGLKSIVRVESIRTVNGATSTEKRYYLTSLAADKPGRIARTVRGHWGIENKVHWVLDVAYNEDKSRIRTDNAPANMAIIRQITLNMLKRNKTVAVGVKTRRLLAGWDEAYLLSVLKS